MNWWGVYAMPVGVALCFGPVLVAWVMAEMKAEPAKKSEQKKRH